MTPEETKEYKRQWYLKNKERVLERVRNYNRDNSELVYKTKRRYRENNLEKFREYSAKYLSMNKEKHKEIYLKKKVSDPKRIILNRLRARCKQASIRFDLSYEDFDLPEFCPVLNYKLELGCGKIGKNSYSIDRIDPSKGYTKGNIQVLSMRANCMKQDATPEELRMFARWVLKTIPEEPDVQT